MRFGFCPAAVFVSAEPLIGFDSPTATMSTATDTIEEFVNKEYQYGFVTDMEADAAPRGLSEDTVRLISKKKNEPEWLLEWRLKAFRYWLTMKEPTREK